MRFLLGTHRAAWLERYSEPMFLSHRQLAERRTLPRARGPWALDSGGFTEIALHGRWLTTTDGYVNAVRRYASEIGNLAWAAPMDWMCEPTMLEKTGLTIREHQERTVANYLELRGRGPFIPVLQGWSLADYLACVELYRDAGVNLTEEPLVGLGSVCRRQDTTEIARIVLALQPLRLHGFGVKTIGLERYSHLLASADSMAWSYRARRSPPMPGCKHRSCANCPRFAFRWRERIIAVIDRPRLFAC